MNPAHFHLLVNHLPIIIPMVGFLVLIAGFISKNTIVQRTALCIFILGALATIPSYVSGEGAEEIVEEIVGVSHDNIHVHEEIAEVFALLSYALGLSSLFALWAVWKQKTFAEVLVRIIALYSCVVLYYAILTGNSGGMIRHTEMQETRYEVPGTNAGS